MAPALSAAHAAALAAAGKREPQRRAVGGVRGPAAAPGRRPRFTEGGGPRTNCRGAPAPRDESSEIPGAAVPAEAVSPRPDEGQGAANASMSNNKKSAPPQRVLGRIQSCPQGDWLRRNCGRETRTIWAAVRPPVVAKHRRRRRRAAAGSLLRLRDGNRPHCPRTKT